jgi:hypothetical protein
MAQLTDGTNLASDLNLLASIAEERLLETYGSKEAVEERVNGSISLLRDALEKMGTDVATLVVTTLVKALVRTRLPRRVVL